MLCKKFISHQISKLNRMKKIHMKTKNINEKNLDFSLPPSSVLPKYFKLRLISKNIRHTRLTAMRKTKTKGNFSIFLITNGTP